MNFKGTRMEKISADFKLYTCNIFRLNHDIDAKYDIP